MDQSPKSTTAFTILEVLIVVSIIALLSSIVFINYRGGEKQLSLQRAVYQLAQDIRLVQEMAISSQTPPAGLCSDNFPAGGYGIYLEKDSNSYIIFADCDGNNQCDDPLCKRPVGDDDLAEKIKEISFGKEEIKISGFSEVVWDYLAITFLPPNPEVTIKNNFSSERVDFITIFISGANKSVSVNKVGLIDIE